MARPRSPSDSDMEENLVVDPDLRLRTVRTAASTLAEYAKHEERVERRQSKVKGSFFSRKSAEKKRAAAVAAAASQGPRVTGLRRKIYLNTPLPRDEIDAHGEPIVRYVRNKVRTTKYTWWAFIPKNLYEQFRRVANLYFLVLVVLQFFTVFGSTSPGMSAMPLAVILAFTAIKDAVEDRRRGILDEQVNTSAATKLGNWRNVNQPTDPRPWMEKLLRINPPGRLTKGVRRLRERESTLAGEDVQIVLSKGSEGTLIQTRSVPASTVHLTEKDVPEHSYPPRIDDMRAWQGGAGSLSAYQESLRSRPDVAVMDYGRRTTGLARWERTLWKKLEVGDIVLLRENEQIPADIAVLSTSDPENMCYVETKNLDGETNLKPRRSIKSTSNMTSEEDIERASFVLDSEPPHANLYLYNGVLRYRDPSSGELKSEAVTINELLLRGCTVRNTAWIVGLVVFTGADTKIMMNGGETPSKRSKIEKETNFNVIANFVILIIGCAICAIANGLFDDKSGTSADVFEIDINPTNSAFANALVTFVSCLILFQNIVPISLYISIEIVKTIQAYFISQDLDMYYAPLDAPCVPKTWNISDDLGQIEYIFSDKTGTLTQNIMDFQKCSVNGIQYGEGVTEAQRGAAKRAGREETLSPAEQDRQLLILKETMLRKMAQGFQNPYAQPQKLTLVSPRLAEELTDRSSRQRPHLVAFFRALAVCHSVLPDRPEPREHPFRLEYKAESPDEAALVAAARDVGFPFVQKGKAGVDIEVMGVPEHYVLLQTLEFNSTRKRMSVVVRNPEGQLVLYCKGADSVIYQRLAEDHDQELKAKTQADMEAFANGGLRTLCIAYRNLTEEEYSNWVSIYEAASSSIEDRDGEIDKANELIEHSLQLLGATALEDKLQEGVPDAIESLHKAGIKLWILTGDKIQTAIEIGFSCNLLKNDMDVMILSADNEDSARTQIEGGLNKIASVLGPPKVKNTERGFIVGARAAFAVVIDGDTLRYALSPSLSSLFLTLATQCETVVCCRVSPAQKAMVVKLVKEGRKAMTLSIGDGANDVAMIQEANIGCGLLGLEGSQAAMSADYAFGQFRFLTKLLIVHGRWSYQRIADMHSNFFYKNVIWTCAMFWYQIYCNFDATYMYDYTFILLYNLAFTSLPVIVLGAFDQDLNAKAALAFPQLYIRGIRGLEYTKMKFWMYMLDGFYQSAVVFYVPYVIWTLGLTVNWYGRDLQALSDFGTTIAVSAVLAANAYVGLNTRYWTYLTWISCFGSTILMVWWIVVYSYWNGINDILFVDEVEILFSEIIFWATVFLAVVIALGPRYIVRFVKSAYMPLDKDIVREMWVMGDLKDRLGIQHRRDIKKRGDLEKTPMFQQPHYRSESEISTIEQLDYPPIRNPQMGSPGSSTDGSPNITQPLVGRRPPRDPSPIQMEEAHLDDGLSPQARREAATPDYRGSYYSASDIPSPSPLPIHYAHSPGGSRTPLSAASSATYAAPSPRTATQAQWQPPSHEEFEMHVRSPSDEWVHPPSHLPPSGSEASQATVATYDTAYDGFVDVEYPPDEASRGASPAGDPYVVHAM